MTVFRFGECEIDDSRRRLRVTGEERHVEPGVFDLLLILANRGDTIVTRDELIESVWKGRTVSDSAISVRVNAARRAVDDDGRRQAVIQTVPRRGFRLAVTPTRIDDGGVIPTVAAADDSASPVDDRPVVGIFPFEALGDELPDYLVRGIAEDLATELSRFREIMVTAPYSTFRHDFDAVDRFEVARSLGITHLVTGSLQGTTAVQRINVRLLNVENGDNLWSERYEVNGIDILAARDDAVMEIVFSLVQGLAAHQSTVARRKATSNLSAYECLLRALHIYKWGITSLDEARQALFWFERAIELDPDYARARAWRECCNANFWSAPPTHDEIDRVSANMRLALALDENDHEVHRLKGAAHMCCGEHELGDFHLTRSVEMNPNDAHVLLSMGTYRSFLARTTDSLQHVDDAFARNPLHPLWYWQNRAIALFGDERYEESIDNMQRAGANNETALLYLAAAQALLGQSSAATSSVRRLQEMNPDAAIDWLEVAYPTRCYEDSTRKERFYEGLRLAGL